MHSSLEIKILLSTHAVDFYLIRIKINLEKKSKIRVRNKS